MSPLRAARSRRLTALVRSSALAVGASDFLRAVRSAERCARLRMAAARDFRMSFFAERMFGTISPELADGGRTDGTPGTSVKYAGLAGGCQARAWLYTPPGAD